MQIDIQREVKSQNLQKQSNNNEDNSNINNDNNQDDNNCYHHYNKNNNNDNNDYNCNKHNKQSYNNNKNNNNNDDDNNNYDITNLINQITFHVISKHFHIEGEEVSKALYSMIWRGRAEYYIAAAAKGSTKQSYKYTARKCWQKLS